MAKFRKTALIEATQWHKMGDHPAVILKSDPHRYADEGIPWIDTLEGGHVVTSGDWIATGIRGEHWPIKPDVFAATYEPVEAGQATELDRLRAVVEAIEAEPFWMTRKVREALSEYRQLKDTPA